LQIIYTLQCHKLLTLSHTNLNVCKSVKTVWKDSVYQVSHRVTQLQFLKSWQLSCLLTFLDDFYIIMLQIVHFSSKKPKHLQKCHNSQERLSLPVFTQSYTVKILDCERKLTTSLSVGIFKWILHHNVTNCVHFHKKIKMSVKVSKQSEKTQPTGFHTE